MLCVIPQIFKDASDHSDIDHRKQVNNFIKTFFRGLYEDEFHFTLDLFWTGYTDLDKNIGLLDGDEFIWKSKDIRRGPAQYFPFCLILWYIAKTIPTL